MKICPKCQKMNGSGAPACSGCGASLLDIDESMEVGLSAFGMAPTIVEFNATGAKPLEGEASFGSAGQFYGASTSLASKYAQLDSVKGIVIPDKRVAPCQPWK